VRCEEWDSGGCPVGSKLIKRDICNNGIISDDPEGVFVTFIQSVDGAGELVEGPFSFGSSRVLLWLWLAGWNCILEFSTTDDRTSPKTMKYLSHEAWTHTMELSLRYFGVLRCDQSTFLFPFLRPSAGFPFVTLEKDGF